MLLLHVLSLNIKYLTYMFSSVCYSNWKCHSWPQWHWSSWPCWWPAPAPTHFSLAIMSEGAPQISDAATAVLSSKKSHWVDQRAEINGIDRDTSNEQEMTNKLDHNQEYNCKFHGFYPSTWKKVILSHITIELSNISFQHTEKLPILQMSGSWSALFWQL